MSGRRRSQQRTGKTLRRMPADAARQIQGANLLEVGIQRAFTQALLPPRPADEPDMPRANVNHWGFNRVMLAGQNLDTSVHYSTNKRNRWSTLQQVHDKYSTMQELHDTALFLIDQTAHPNGSRAESVATNCGFVLEAADELRCHKQSLRRAKRRGFNAARDEFKFSEKLREQQERDTHQQLRCIGRRGRVNAKSTTHSCNLWSRLYDVSEDAERERLELQHEIERRAQLTVTVCRPGVDKDACAERQNDYEPQRSPQWIVRREKNRLCRSRAYQIVEGAAEAIDNDEDAFVAEIASFEDAVDAEEAPSGYSPTLADFLDCGRVRGGQKDAKRLRKQKEKRQKTLRQNRRDEESLTALVDSRKGRDSESSDHSSGYSSGRDTTATPTATPTATSTLMADAWLKRSRPTVRLPVESSTADSLRQVFGDAAFVEGGAHPLKFAVALRQDLTEFAAFEQVDSNGTFRVCHDAAGDQPLTSTEEIVQSIAPLVTLENLLKEQQQLHQAQQNQQQQQLRHPAKVKISSWSSACVQAEAAARIEALMSQPNFKAASQDESKKQQTERDFEIVNSHCEICCLEFDDASGSFEEASTTLVACGHAFCNACWISHVVSSVTAGVSSVTCPAFACDSVLDAATLLWFCPAVGLRAFAEAAFRRSLSAQTSTVGGFCKRKFCGRLLRSGRGRNVACLCGATCCLQCGGEPHWPADCATAALYSQKMQSLGHHSLALCDLNAEVDVNAKRCPTCFLVIEKGVGCNHMSCPCGEHFCWWCGLSMRNHQNGGPCYRGGSRSEFFLKKKFSAADSLLVPNYRQSRVYCTAVRLRLERKTWGDVCRRNRNSLRLVFFTHAHRFCGLAASEANSLAEKRTCELITVVNQAAFLIEFALADLDIRQGVRRRQRSAGLSISSHLRDLLVLISNQASTRVGSGAKRAEKAASWLLRLQHQILHVCQHLDSFVRARQQERP